MTPAIVLMCISMVLAFTALFLAAYRKDRL